MRVPIVFAVAALGAAVLGCGKSPGDRLAGAALSAATGQPVTVDKDGDQIAFNTGKGALRISGGDHARLPAGFPRDVYLPPRYTVESAMEMPDTTIVSLLAPGEVAALSAQASRRMQAQGWKQVLAMRADGGNQLLGFEKEQRSATVALSPADRGVKLGLQLARRH